MKYKLVIIPAMLSLLALSLSACNRGYAADDHSKIHVGIVFDIGGKDDRSFNAAAWQGVQRAAKDLPIVLRDIEPGTPNAIEPAMRAFAERNYDLIIGVGFAQAPIMGWTACGDTRGSLYRGYLRCDLHSLQSRSGCEWSRH